MLSEKGYDYILPAHVRIRIRFALRLAGGGLHRRQRRRLRKEDTQSSRASRAALFHSVSALEELEQISLLGRCGFLQREGLLR